MHEYSVGSDDWAPCAPLYVRVQLLGGDAVLPIQLFPDDRLVVGDVLVVADQVRFGREGLVDIVCVWPRNTRQEVGIANLSYIRTASIITLGLLLHYYLPDPW
jgi:hypothetical protein